MLLIVIVSAVIFFVLVLALLAIAAIAEYGQMQRIRFDPAARPFTLSLLEPADPAHALLWSTQVPALQLLRDAGAHGLKYEEAYGAYGRAARKYPELYEGSSFAQWLLFLEKHELISLAWSRVKLTGHGQQFLEQCVTEIQMVHR